MKKRKNFILLGLLVLSVFCTVIAALGKPPVEASAADTILYRASFAVFFILIDIGLLLELVYLKLKDKISFLNSNKKGRHIIFWCLIFLMATILGVTIQNTMSEEYHNRYEAYRAEQKAVQKEKDEKQGDLNYEAQTPEQSDQDVNENIIPEIPDSSTDEDIKIQPQLPDHSANEPDEIDLPESEDGPEPETDRSSERVTDDDPLIFTFDSTEYTVGNCTFSLREIKAASQIFKSGSYNNEMRIYGTVRNNSAEGTAFLIEKVGNIVGVYHGSEEDIDIGGNSHLFSSAWGTDAPGEKDKFSTNFWLEPGEERDFQAQVSYTDLEPITYDYQLNMDLYFSNNDEEFVLTFT